MTYTVIILLTRKASLTPDEFKDYFENKHLPLVKGIFGPLCPKPNRRFYLARAASDNSDNMAQTPSLPQLVKGDPHTIDFDCISELEWKDEKAFKEFYEMMNRPEIAAQLRPELEKFIGGEKVLVIGEVVDTLPSGWE